MKQPLFKPGNPYHDKLLALLQSVKTRQELLTAIVNAPFHDLRETTHLDLGIIVLLLVDAKEGTIDRIALSQTPAAEGAVKMSEKPFADIKIPLNHPSNIIAQAITTDVPQATGDWKHLFTPALPPQAARFNQAGAGIECSYVYPLQAGDGGALIYSFFQPGQNLGLAHRTFMSAYAKMVTAALRALL